MASVGVSETDPMTSAFLNNAGSSLPTAETLDATIGHLRREAEIGGYLAADEVAETLAQARADLGALVGGEAAEVAFAISDSAAWVKALWGWVLGGNIPKGSVVLTDQLSYHSHYAALRQTQALGGFEVQVMASLEDGTVDVEKLAQAMDSRVSLMCVTMIGTHSGNVNPVDQIGAIARAAGIPMFVDGCQAFAQLEVDVRALGCSVFTGTGRKWLRAPRGTGMLWVASEIADRFQPPGVDSNTSTWSAESGLVVNPGMAKFEEFEVPVAAQVGLAVAARQALESGMAAIEAKVVQRADYLRTQLRGIDGVKVHDNSQRVCGIVTFSVAGTPATDVVKAVAANGAIINLSPASWATLDLQAKGLTQVVRVSPHTYNTDAEVDLVVEAVQAPRG